MASAITMEEPLSIWPVTDKATRTVRQGKRVIGFVQHFPEIKSIGRRAGWTFIPNRDDISARCPKPAPVLADPAAVLAYVIATLEG